ncbi:Lysosomal beta glucosidase-like [Heracleum sosnowskyi]|uniref:beta-glucosidase n=1 Tax=Heracleum sosnowskyi TaxID=360622 RepID=A0AAD8LXG0_9APIA|nr:Lysosomal beta glucosidase-like [Heracleum sosnowskyi]
MTQIERKIASPDIMKQYYIASSILSGGGSVPAPKASAETWVNMVNEFQKGALSTRLGIPMLYVTRDPELVKKIGDATALQVRATGIPYTFAPCIAVCRDPRWGLCYESYSEDHKIVHLSPTISVVCFGNDNPLPSLSSQHTGLSVFLFTKVVACAKHFVGDGGTVKGIDENNTVIDFNHLLRIHMPAYLDSIRKGVVTVMVSYSSWNGKKMHGNRDLVTGFLKDKLKFRGFVISDWQGIDKMTSPPHSNYSYSVQAGVQAGIDMMMVPENFTEFVDDLIFQVKNKIVPMSRIDDAVKRILRVKFVMGLFEKTLADLSLAKQLGHQEHRQLAREAVRKSLVLLKSGKTSAAPLLPLPKKAPKILVAGTHANDLGYHCGGWTIEWQGLQGNDHTIGAIILTVVTKVVYPSTKVICNENPNTEFVLDGGNTNLTVPGAGARFWYC